MSGLALFNKIVHPRVQRSDQIGVPHHYHVDKEVVNSTIHGRLITITLYLAMCKMLYLAELQYLMRVPLALFAVERHSSQQSLPTWIKDQTLSLPCSQLTNSVMQILAPSVNTSSIFNSLSAKHVATGRLSHSGNSSTLSTFFQPTTSVPVSKSCSHSLNLQTAQGGSSFPFNQFQVCPLILVYRVFTNQKSRAILILCQVLILVQHQPHHSLSVTNQ